MPKIDENKLADILNTLLTDNIKMGSNLVQDLENSVNVFNKNVDSLDKKVTARAEEVKELAKILTVAPKLGKTLKISTIVTSFASGAALAAMFFSYSLSSVTFHFMVANNAQKELTLKYDELENYAILLKNKNEALERTLGLTLTPSGREKFNKLFSEELQKIKEQQ
jgi:hypothetical protein